MATPDLDSIFAPDIIDIFTPCVAPQNLTHEYTSQRLNSNGEQYDFARISALLSGLRADVAAWYTATTGQEFNTFKLGDLLIPVRERFWSDDRFAEAMALLELSYGDREKATIPWWNEVAAGELAYERRGNGVHVTIAPRHSLETQLMRAGIQRPVKNVSVGGIILTAPERDAPNGYLVIGLRGGASYSNLYHINAGALRADEKFKTGQSTIYDQFKTMELAPEFGIGERDIAQARLHARFFDCLLDRGPTYMFAVHTPFTQAQLHQKWQENLDEDKAEHDAPVYIPADAQAVDGFIREHYRGFTANKDGRKDDDRLLLHPGALALAAWSGMSVFELRSLYRDGIW